MKSIGLILLVLSFVFTTRNVHACDGLSVSVLSNEYVGNGVYQVTVEYCEYVTNSGQTAITGFMIQTDGANIVGTTTPSFTSNSTGVTINYSLFNATTAEWGSWDNNPVQNPPFLADGDPVQCVVVVILTDGPVSNVTVAGSSSPNNDGAGFTFWNGRYTCLTTANVPPVICSSAWTAPLFCEGDDTLIDLNGLTNSNGVFSGNGVDSNTGIFNPSGVTFPSEITLNVGDQDFGCETTLEVSPVQLEITGAQDSDLCEGESTDLLVGSSGGISTCEYTLNLFNSSGLGWTGGASVNVFLNGNSYGSYTISGSASSTSFIISVSTGDALTFSYNSGSNDNENSITVTDYNGNQVYSQSPLSGGNLPGSISVVCQDPDFLYEWTPSTGLSTSEGPSVTASPQQTTTYTVTLTNIDSGCQTTAELTIQVIPIQIPEFDPFEDICQNSPPPAFPTTSLNNLTGTWSPEVSTENAGTFTYTFTPDPTEGCPNQEVTQDLIVLPSDHPLCAIFCEVTASNNGPLCEGEELQLFGSSDDVGTYSWTGPNGFSSSEQNPVIPVSSALMQGEYTVTFSIVGCEATATTIVVVNAYPTAAFSVTPQSGQPPLEVQITNQSSGAITSYAWSFGNGNFSNEDFLTTTELFLTVGNPTIILIVSNEGCNDTATVQLDIQYLPLSYIVPNVFTPNGDGSNDYFDLNQTNAEIFELTILNRWGNVMAEITDVNSPGWDGKTQSGNDAVDGVYFYKYRIVGLNGEEVEGHGFLHLIRD
jgi:gliding motility-associated-like protein